MFFRGRSSAPLTPRRWLRPLRPWAWFPPLPTFISSHLLLIVNRYRSWSNFALRCQKIICAPRAKGISVTRVSLSLRLSDIWLTLVPETPITRPRYKMYYSVSQDSIVIIGWTNTNSVGQVTHFYWMI